MQIADLSSRQFLSYRIDVLSINKNFLQSNCRSYLHSIWQGLDNLVVAGQKDRATESLSVELDPRFQLPDILDKGYTQGIQIISLCNC